MLNTLTPGTIPESILRYLAGRGEAGATIAEVASLYDELACVYSLHDVEDQDRVGWAKVHLGRLKATGCAQSAPAARPAGGPSRGPYRRWYATKAGVTYLKDAEYTRDDRL